MMQIDITWFIKVCTEQFMSAGTDADTFVPENEELLILKTLQILAQKEPEKNTAYVQITQLFSDCLAQEKQNHPSQRMSLAEEIIYAG